MSYNNTCSPNCAIFNYAHNSYGNLIRFNPFLWLWCNGIHCKGKKNTLKILIKEESYYRGFKNTQDDFFYPSKLAVTDFKHKVKPTTLKSKHWFGCWLDSADEEQCKCKAVPSSCSLSSLKREGHQKIIPPVLLICMLLGKFLNIHQKCIWIFTGRGIASPGSWIVHCHHFRNLTCLADCFASSEKK